MAGGNKVALNKAGLAREKRSLSMFRRYLPSLELKREQLMAEANAEKRALNDTTEKIAEETRRIEATLPMLAYTGVELSGLVRIEEVVLGEANHLGVRLPVLEEVRLARLPYSLFAKPHWVDKLVDIMEAVIRLHLLRDLQVERKRLLDVAVLKTTQRVNLFDKVLIPQAKENIRRIRIALSDAEKAAVVRSKLSKARHEKARAEAVAAVASPRVAGEPPGYGDWQR